MSARQSVRGKRHVGCGKIPAWHIGRHENRNAGKCPGYRVPVIVGDFPFARPGVEGVIGFNPHGMLVAATGAVVVLPIHHAVIGRRAVQTPVSGEEGTS